MKYTDWTLAELVKATNDRGLQVVHQRRKGGRIMKGSLSKRDYVRALEIADHPDSLPQFLKLPAELRYMVYAELFHPEHAQGGESKRHLDILLVNKELNAEVQTIFLDSCKHMTIDIDTDSVSINGRQALLVTTEPSCDLDDSIDSDMNSKSLPNFIFKVKHIRACITIASPIPARYFSRYRPELHPDVSTNRVLYSLCSALQGQHQLLTMTIDLQDGSDLVNAEKKREALQPLSLLGPVRFKLDHKQKGPEPAGTITIDDPAYFKGALHGQYINLKAALFHEIETLKAFSRSTTAFATLATGEFNAVSDKSPPLKPAHLSAEHENISELYDRMQQHEDHFWYCDSLCDERWEREAMQDLEEMQGMSNKLGVDWVAIQFAKQMATTVRKAREQRLALPGARE